MMVGEECHGIGVDDIGCQIVCQCAFDLGLDVDCRVPIEFSVCGLVI